MDKRLKESYSSLSLFKQCPYKYKLRYIDKIYINQKSIALSLGNLCHKILEEFEKNNHEFSVEELTSMLNNGFPKEKIAGLDKIKLDFYEDFFVKNEKSNLDYDTKIANFMQKLQKPQEGQWKCIATEKEFSIKINDVILTGKIDKVEVNEKDEIRVTDYKTANLVYEDKDLKTPLQMYIYALACNEIYHKMPTYFVYDFVFLNETREAMSKGWEKRGATALNKLITQRNEGYDNADFAPKPSPLCYYCEMKGVHCPYYSLWTPDNKVYNKVNQDYALKQNTDKTNNEFWW